MAKMNSFYKVFHIIRLLNDNRNGVTAQDIKRYFDDKGWDYSLRSAQHDIEMVETVIAEHGLDNFLEVIKKGKQKIIKYKNPPKLIGDMIRQRQQKYILKLLEKILGKERVEEEFKDLLEYGDYSMFEILGFNISQYDVNQRIVDDITRAIKRKSMISFTYQRRTRKIKKTYSNVIPLKILIMEDGWYLLAKKQNDKILRTFIVDFISDIDIGEKITEEIDIGKIDETVRNAKTIWYIGQKKVTIKAQLSSQISHKVLEMAEKGITYFSNQKIVNKDENNNLIINFDIADDDNFQVDFKKQVYPWLPDIKILSPKKFVNFIKSDLKKVL